jgi:hypothetical protein
MASAPESPELRATTPAAEQGNASAPSDEEPCSRFPVHPIPQLQGPFEESIFEASQEKVAQWTVHLDAQSRRKELLENAEYERLCGRKWRQRAGERQVKSHMTRPRALFLPLGQKLIGYRYHPLWKLISQIAFGVHLLAKGLAKSNIEVLKILQHHVDEFDGFIERNTEDYFIIQVDVRTRIQYLSLPLENLDIFDEMLQDRNFRLAMVEYNEQIEHAVDRFTMAVKDSLKDIQKGREAIGALWHYIRQSAKENRPLPSDLAALYNAMLANTEGWNTALSKLSRKGMALESALAQLGLAITEMQRRVGVASRRGVVSTQQCDSSKSLSADGMLILLLGIAASEFQRTFPPQIVQEAFLRETFIHPPIPFLCLREATTFRPRYCGSSGPAPHIQPDSRPPNVTEERSESTGCQKFRGVDIRIREPRPRHIRSRCP